MAAFVEKLEAASRTNKSLLCVGLDPDPRRMPVADIFQFNQAIIDTTADLVCAYKPNLAFYEAEGLPGLEALQRTVQHIHQVAPGVPIIGDSKRGDIGPSGEAYARALFDFWDFDATTANGFGGQDTLQPLYEHQERGVIVWCRSSNEGARDLQDLLVGPHGQQRPVYEIMAAKLREWNTNGNLGLVVGATYPQELKVVRSICPDMPILIPGVGAQGGALEDAVRWGPDARGRLAIINSSRGVIYASQGNDYALAARQVALGLRNNINAVLDQEGKGWS